MNAQFEMISPDNFNNEISLNKGSTQMAFLMLFSGVSLDNFKLRGFVRDFRRPLSLEIK